MYYVLTYIIQIDMKSCIILYKIRFREEQYVAIHHMHFCLALPFQKWLSFYSLTRAPLGLLDFHALLGGGVFEHPPPSNSAPGPRSDTG